MNGQIKITFFKLSGVDDFELLSESRIDVPDNASVVDFCFAPQHPELNVDCFISTSAENMDRTNTFDMGNDIVESEMDMRLIGTQLDFPEYVIERARLRSFDEWPKVLKQTPEQLSAAGFFYTQREDRVICFCCGGGIRAWEEHDDPWEQHALHYGKCDYLKLMKGPEYVASVKEKLKINDKDAEIPNLTSLFEDN